MMANVMSWDARELCEAHADEIYFMSYNMFDRPELAKWHYEEASRYAAIISWKAVGQ